MELAWPGPRRAHNSVAAAKVPHRRSPDALLPQVESKSGMSYFMPYYMATSREQKWYVTKCSIILPQREQKWILQKKEKGEGNYKDKDK